MILSGPSIARALSQSAVVFADVHAMCADCARDLDKVVHDQRSAAARAECGQRAACSLAQTRVPRSCCGIGQGARHLRSRPRRRATRTWVSFDQQ